MLKKLFGLEDEKKLQPGEWETIGTRFFGEEDFGNVPAVDTEADTRDRH